jgi:hypothetical protein
LPTPQAEFEDPVEVFQLKRQFQELLAAGGDDGDGLIQAEELLACARAVGDVLLPAKVNLAWARTVVASLLGLDAAAAAELPPGAGCGFEHFCAVVAKMRRSMKADARGRARKLRDLTRPPDEDDEDSDSDNESDVWLYPATVPRGAKVGSVLTVPLPGGQVAFAPVPAAAGAPSGATPATVFVPMPPEAVQAAVTLATAAAAAPPSDEAAASAAASPTDGRYVAGAGAAYVASKGRQRFCLNTFLALREAASLKADLPPLEGWMLKRGDAMSLGYLNAWKLRCARERERREGTRHSSQATPPPMQCQLL